MPIYEYQCEACGELTEALQKISDDPLKDCPACGKPALRKKISAVAFRLKGSGWYETDFKKDKQKNLAGDKDGGSGGDSTPSAADKSDGKSSAKDSGSSDSGSSSSSTSGSTSGNNKGTGSPAA